MIAALLRSVWLLTVISIVALTLPARGEMPPRRVTSVKDCCSHKPAPHGHCGGDASQSQERQCCAGCVLVVSLINTLPRTYVFSRSRGQTLLPLSIDGTARSARPPVPPPRA